eukprot:gene9499-12796_t
MSNKPPLMTRLLGNPNTGNVDDKTASNTARNASLSPGHVPRDFTLQRENTFSRKSTFNRTYTIDGEVNPFEPLARTLTEQIRAFDPDEQFTKAIIQDYSKHNEEGVQGDMPLQSGFARKKAFWVVMLLNGLQGVILAIVASLFSNITKNVPNQYLACSYGNDDDDPNCTEWYQGKKYYIYVVASAGFLVGVIRWAFDYPFNLPGLFKEINDCHVEPKWAPVSLLVSTISLSGGATLGPEAGMAAAGGGVGSFIAEHLDMEQDYKDLVVLGGMSAALGALFPNPLLSAMFFHELGNPPRDYMEATVLLSFPAIISFVVYYKLEGCTFLEHISSKSAIMAITWEETGFDLWQCGTGFFIGCMSAIFGLLIVISIGVNKQIFNRIRTRLARFPFLKHVIPPVIGGTVIGTLNWALPLTFGNGELVMGAIIGGSSHNRYSKSLLISTGFARLIMLGLSMNCGFVGGLIFPMLTMGAIAGSVTISYYPYIPQGLAFACFMCAIPSSIVPMPFTFVCLVVFVFYFGLYQVAPIFIATMTAYMILSGSGLLKNLQLRSMAREKAAQAAAEEAELERKKQIEEESQYTLDQYTGGVKHKTSATISPLNVPKG